MPVIHPFAPVWDENSRILILGSFPSVRSRAEGFYYAHPQNRFWRVLAALWNEPPIPADPASRQAFLLRHCIALWDSVQSCEITLSSDASIRQVVPSDLAWLLSQASIREVYCNGRRSYELYQRYCQPATGLEAVPLPSTSAANAACSFEQLVAAWKVILPKE